MRGHRGRGGGEPRVARTAGQAGRRRTPSRGPSQTARRTGRSALVVAGRGRSSGRAPRRDRRAAPVPREPAIERRPLRSHPRRPDGGPGASRPPGRVGRVDIRTPWLVGGAILALALLVAGVGAYLVLPSATIAVTPRPEAVGPIQVTVVADPERDAARTPPRASSRPRPSRSRSPWTTRSTRPASASSDPGDRHGPLPEPRPHQHEPDPGGQRRADRLRHPVPDRRHGHGATRRARRASRSSRPRRASRSRPSRADRMATSSRTRSSSSRAARTRSSSRSPTPRRRPAGDARSSRGSPRTTSTARSPR